MHLNDLDARLWSHYPPILRPVDRARRVLHGLSGSLVWKVATESGHVAVRRFPERTREAPGPFSQPHWDQPPFQHDHQHLFCARLHGWAEVPQPLPNNEGRTFTKHGGAWWDVCTWQPGEPGELPIDGPPLKAAMQFIGRWHSFWTKVNAGGLGGIDVDAVGIRRDEWRRLWPRSHPDLAGIAGPADPLDLAGRTMRAVRARTRRTEEQLHELHTLLAHEPKVYCHGDLHREHLLFSDDKVTGFIDLSCRWDYAAADLARWLSTTVEPNRWAETIEWYREVALLSPSSERAVPLLAETGLVIAALRWECWLFGPSGERRFFPRPDLAYDRWRVVVERLEADGV